MRPPHGLAAPEMSSRPAARPTHGVVDVGARQDNLGKEAKNVCVFVTMAMSLDGFITGPQDDAQKPGRHQRHAPNGLARRRRDRQREWQGREIPTGSPGQPDGLRRGAGDRCSDHGEADRDFAGYWGGDHHNGVPIFVPTHQPPADNPYERVHYVTDGIEACVKQAKAAAGDRDVMLHGAYTAQEALKAGVLDAIEIQLRSYWDRDDGCSTTCRLITSS